MRKIKEDVTVTKQEALAGIEALLKFSSRALESFAQLGVDAEALKSEIEDGPDPLPLSTLQKIGAAAEDFEKAVDGILEEF